jgi:hypothetical protein
LRWKPCPLKLSSDDPTRIQISLLAVALYVTSAGLGEADPRHISLMPDPHGEFIRLCAPFQTPRYAHPEGVCDCLWSAVFDRIDDPDLMDAILYGIMERGVPSVDAAALPQARSMKWIWPTARSPNPRWNAFSVKGRRSGRSKPP